MTRRGDVMIRRALARLHLALRPVDSGICLCGHHRHDRPRATCDRYQPIRVTDPHLPHMVTMAIRHAVLDRRIARDMTVVDIHRRSGIELLVRVAAARAYDHADPDHRDQLLDGLGWPAWFIAARALGEHRQLSRQLRRFSDGDQRALGVELLRYAARQEVSR